MAQQLRALAAILKDPGSIPNMAAYNYLLTPVPGPLVPSSGLNGHQAYT